MSLSVFKMGFEGKNVFDKAISADDFADYLKKINRMVAHIAKAKNLVNEKFSIENYKLYLNNFEEGSVKAGFTFPPSHFQPETLNEFGISSKHGSYENLVINLEKVIKFSQQKDGHTLIQKDFPNRFDRIEILKDLESLTKNSDFGLYFDFNHFKKLHTYRISKETNDTLNRWLKMERTDSPKLVGEKRGMKLNSDNTISFYTRLLNDENVVVKLSSKFEDKLSNIPLHELVRIDGHYKKKPGKMTRGKIVRVSDIHSIKDEFTLTFEQYRESFRDDPEFGDEEYQEYIRDMYDIYKRNYSYLKMLGEDD